MTRPPPTFLFLQTNQRCNLKCTHCFYWKRNDDDRGNYLTPARRRELVAEFAELGGKNIVTCGGEPMLDLLEYFDLMGAARANGLGALSVVNGTRIKTLEMACDVLTHGPTEITVSIDHWLPEEHDRLRGAVGSHRMAMTALELLLKARRQLGVKTPIYVMTILSEDTWPTLDLFYSRILTDLGADKLKLNPIQPSFQGGGPDPYYAAARVRDVPGCMAMIAKCDELFSIPRNPAWLAAVEMHLRSAAMHKPALLGWHNPEGSTEAICNSYERNIMVDLYGNARLCFSDSYPHAPLTQRGDLAEFWNHTSLPVRDAMVGCKQFCGVSHSVRREPSLLTLKGHP